MCAIRFLNEGEVALRENRRNVVGVVGGILKRADLHIRSIADHQRGMTFVHGERNPLLALVHPRVLSRQVEQKCGTSQIA
jgi:hypothetical protein